MCVCLFSEQQVESLRLRHQWLPASFLTDGEEMQMMQVFSSLSLFTHPLSTNLTEYLRRPPQSEITKILIRQSGWPGWAVQAKLYEMKRSPGKFHRVIVFEL
ncbi:hypothetical protein NPIL_674401 [Nephila pilipes]|uniref:Uncharacterized protein n=1 Tax=Nephila pilipes TaxID=299642 RepID=A0A8X6Q9S3_NEPPI|nr:hypothetical protein NPIL_674401 [Nephila pilipes]